MGRIEDLSFVKKTVDLRKNKDPFYKKDFYPKNWRAPFKANISWRPWGHKPTYLFKWKTDGSVSAKVPQFEAYGAQARLPGKRRRKHKRKYTKK